MMIGKIMMNDDEVKKLEREIDLLVEPLQKRIKEIRDAYYQAEEDAQKKHYKDTVEGRMFYADKDTWSGFVDVIYLIKPLSCDDWTSYNCCKTIQFAIKYKNKKFLSISTYLEDERISNFKTHYTELTPELFDKVKALADSEILNVLSNFKL